MSSPQVSGPYLALVVFLIVAFVALGREFWMARGLDKIRPLGLAAFAVPLAVFGAEHMVSAKAVMRLIPAWMPGKLFWTYFVGAALFAASLSILFRIRIRLAATLLAIMFFCFVLMMDLPAALAGPQNRFAWTLAARQLAFSAGALLLALSSGTSAKTPAENRLATVAFYVVALICMFYGVEHFLHPEGVPVVPLVKTTPAWVPLASLWTILTGIVLVAGGAAMLVARYSREAAAAVGGWIVLLVVTFYLALMIAKPDIEGLNYFADTLMFGGVFLIASSAQKAQRNSETA